MTATPPVRHIQGRTPKGRRSGKSIPFILSRSAICWIWISAGTATKRRIGLLWRIGRAIRMLISDVAGDRCFRQVGGSRGLPRKQASSRQVPSAHPQAVTAFPLDRGEPQSAPGASGVGTPQNRFHDSVYRNDRRPGGRGSESRNDGPLLIRIKIICCIRARITERT
jgi:hypothetical protein